MESPRPFARPLKLPSSCFEYVNRGLHCLPFGSVPVNQLSGTIPAHISFCYHGRMKRRIQQACLAICFLSSLALLAPRALAQDGSVEFVAKATPSGSAEEPVRGFPFYLLSKSFEDIHREAELAYPAPDMDAFIASLDAG